MGVNSIYHDENCRKWRESTILAGRCQACARKRGKRGTATYCRRCADKRAAYAREKRRV